MSPRSACGSTAPDGGHNQVGEPPVHREDRMNPDHRIGRGLKQDGGREFPIRQRDRAGGD
jgi:hypothetical protein